MHDILTPAWVPVVVAIITAIPGTVAAIYAIVGHAKIEQLTLSVNGRLTELLKITARSSKAEGAKEEKDNPTP
jgi:hypothetical protein